MTGPIYTGRAEKDVVIDAVDPVAAEDQHDIAATLGGDGSAYARLVKRYEQRIAAQMWRFTRNPGTLDELVQETFVEAFTSLRNYRGDAPFLHWLRRIATRVGYRHWKGRRRDLDRAERLNAIGPAPEPATSGPSDAAEYLFRLFETLPVQDRLVLTLMYFEECDTREIADRMGWTRSLVKVRAHRARNKLRVLLEEAGVGSADDA
jgi:RNA polymerase sigma-70 factor (ECF subfamily)